MSIMIKIRRISMSDLLTVIILFLCTAPFGLSSLIGSTLNDIISTYGCLAAAPLALCLLGRSKFSIRNYQFTILFLLFRLLILLISIVNSESAAISENVRYLLLIFAVCLTFEHAIVKNKLNKTIAVTLNLYIFYLIINTATMLMYPEGVISSEIYTTNGLASRTVKYHFLGYRIYFGFYLIPILGLLFIRRDIFRTSKGIVLQGLVILDIFLAGSATSIFALVSFYTVILWKYVVKKMKIRSKIKLTNPILFFAYFLVLLVIVVMNSGAGFRAFVASLFGKSETFTGRTTIWFLALMRILERPIGGSGNDDVIFMGGNYWYAHNGVLDLLIQGGIILLAAYVLILIYVYRNLKCVKGTPVYATSLAITSGFLILMLAESIINYSIMFYAIFVIFGRIGSIVKKESSRINLDTTGTLEII